MVSTSDFRLPTSDSTKGGNHGQHHEDDESHDDPDAERNGRVGLEHRPAGVRLPDHVPEALRPRQIDDQQWAAYDDGDQGDQIADAGHAPVEAVAEEIEETGEEGGAAGDAAQEEVDDDVPAPIRGLGEPRGRRRGDLQQEMSHHASSLSPFSSVARSSRAAAAKSSMRRLRKATAPRATMPRVPPTPSADAVGSSLEGSLACAGRR